MKISVPTEVKNREYRVAITPVGVHELVQHGHEVFVQKGAGLGSSITDEEYIAQGATMIEGAEETWAKGEMVIQYFGKRKEGNVELGEWRDILDGLPRADASVAA